MVVALVDSSQTGTSDTFGTSSVIPVPAGAASGHIAVCAIEQWESANPTITPPDGSWTALTPIVSGSQKLKTFWKRLTGADSGNYTFTWTGSQWSMGHCVLISGAVSAGDPIEDSDSTTATNTTVPSLSVDTTTQPFLVHIVANENSASSTPPTNYLEDRDGNYLHTNHRIPGSTGTHTASGGSLSTSTLMLVQLIAIKADAGSSTQTVVVPLLVASSTLFSPEVEQITAVPLLSVPATLFNPIVVSGAATVQVPLLIVPSSVFNPLASMGAVIAPLLTVPATLFNPTAVQLLQIISVLLLSAPSTILNPTIVGGEAGEVPGSISDIARTNMLTDRVLTEPQRLSNVDLMALVLADGAQTLVIKTDATAAVHLWRYLRQVRDS
jgi:hypothetical protein